MNKLVKRLLTGTLAFATILTALPVTAVHASGNQYWTESAERVGYIEQIMNDGSIKSTFHEGHKKVEGETAYCVDFNTNIKNGYKTRSDASTRMSSDQIADVALSLEYVKQYTATHTELNNNQKYLLEQCVVWQRLSEQLGWQCDNVRASYNEISQAVQNEVYAGAKAFVKQSKKLVTGKLREVAIQKIDDQTEALVSMIGDNQVDYRFFLGFKLMVTEDEGNLKNIKKSVFLTFREFLNEVRHTLMNDFVSMSNDEINRYVKMEKLLENKISSRFKIRRLEAKDFAYLMETSYCQSIGKIGRSA